MRCMFAQRQHEWVAQFELAPFVPTRSVDRPGHKITVQKRQNADSESSLKKITGEQRKTRL